MITIRLQDCDVHQKWIWQMLEKQNKTEYVIGILATDNYPDEDHLWQEQAGLDQPMALLGRVRLFASEADAAVYRLARM